MKREKLSRPLLAINKTIIYETCTCIPFPRVMCAPLFEKRLSRAVVAQLTKIDSKSYRIEQLE